MGNLQAMAMAEAIGSGVSLDAALVWHLRSNHFPPLPLTLVKPAKLAIRRCIRGEYERPRVTLPLTVSCRQHGMLCPAWHVAEVLHLDSFIEVENDL